MPLCCDLCAVHRSVRQFHLNEQFKIIEDTAINQIFNNFKNETIEKIEEIEKLKEKMKNNGKIVRENTKLKKSKKIKIFFFYIISYKFGAYIKRFWYTLLTNWHYL